MCTFPCFIRVCIHCREATCRGAQFLYCLTLVQTVLIEKHPLSSPPPTQCIPIIILTTSPSFYPFSQNNLSFLFGTWVLQDKDSLTMSVYRALVVMHLYSTWHHVAFTSVGACRCHLNTSNKFLVPCSFSMGWHHTVEMKSPFPCTEENQVKGWFLRKPFAKLVALFPSKDKEFVHVNPQAWHHRTVDHT